MHVFEPVERAEASQTSWGRGKSSPIWSAAFSLTGPLQPANPWLQGGVAHEQEL